ncbi:MAG TPA: hypothetical protein VK642_11395 [Burkholderiales bacterium]|nr:hypothetical protein [Burkholderiales bacterium]
MLFRIKPANGSLERVPPNWEPRELELEKYLITKEDSNIQVMEDSVFGEPLLLVSNQVRTQAKKRADIFALDRAGNGVIIELKRNTGRLGVETQALQYLAEFSKYRGESFFRKFSSSNGVSKETVFRFLGGKANIDEINTRSRIILVARSFDETVFAIGEWLSSKGVAFRCISYFPTQIGEDRFLSFSVEFDRSLESLYPLIFNSAVREPGIYWHNIGNAEQSWWAFLVAHRQIATGFDNAPGDQGEKILTRYVSGDKVVAYAKGYGAIGYGVIEDPGTYQLIPLGAPGDVAHGQKRHRLSIRWMATAHKLSDGLSADEIRRQFNIYHPVSTSVSMNTSDGNRLLEELSKRFGNAK